MRRLLPILLLLLCGLTTEGQAATVHLSVAASLTNAFNELISAYQQQHPQTRLLPNYAASGALAKQISQGAPSDLFISANPKWMAYLVENSLIDLQQTWTLTSNSLVVVGAITHKLDSFTDLLKLQRIALGSPVSVPAGQYAKQALERSGLYAELEPRLIPAKNVRQALLYAERGEVDGAFVYRTDALLAQRAKILLEVPQSLYNEVTYPAALTRQGEQNPDAIAFAAFLKTDGALEILSEYGFVLHSLH
ncbi:MAG: molybdate ABC transporter substrate-binding protein [Desulfuromonadaceae bacterium]|nr:molybdate ABC transporter substrate-binding protein [Desulfuromonadaceae bacterium]